MKTKSLVKSLELWNKLFFQQSPLPSLALSQKQQHHINVCCEPDWTRVSICHCEGRGEGHASIRWLWRTASNTKCNWKGPQAGLKGSWKWNVLSGLIGGLQGCHGGRSHELMVENMLCKEGQCLALPGGAWGWAFQLASMCLAPTNWATRSHRLAMPD